MNRLREVTVNKESENIFFATIQGNYSEYFFFHVDYVQYPQNTTIYMALDEKNLVRAMLLIWKKQRIQVRGEHSALEFLMKNHHPQYMSITGLEEHNPIIENYYPDYRLLKSLYRMRMTAEDFQSQEKFGYIILDETYREQIARLMKNSDPIFWGKRKGADILIDSHNSFHAIADNNGLLSITGLWEYDNIAYIPIVATHFHHWGKGYASSLISSVISTQFPAKDEVLIMVRTANRPAIHIYTKLGFQIRNTQHMYERPESELQSEI